MSRSPKLFTGILASFALSCFAVVLVPNSQIGRLQPEWDQDTNTVYPVRNDQGREVYVAHGCVTCHSQQIRDPQNGEDIARGWGARRTVARDYILDDAPLLGSSRMGPDLSNVGSKDWRNEAKDDPRRPQRRDAMWHYIHLYNPSSVVRETNMPPYRFLFEKQKVTGQRSLDALPVETEAGYQVVPKPEAVKLVKYLLSLDRSYPLKEVKAAGSTPGAK
jgi:cytochrome c oxidase cbb3-type subunit 2